MNTKRFIEARKTEAIRQGKAKEKLEKVHKKQMAELADEIKAVSLIIETKKCIYLLLIWLHNVLYFFTIIKKWEIMECHLNIHYPS